MLFYKNDNLEYDNNGLILLPHFLLLQKQSFQLHHTYSPYLQPNDTIIFHQGKTCK